jgi:flagellar basal-body rod protein FlgF
MNSGIYTAYSGMKAQSDALDILANNLANVNTTGFKEEKAFFTVLQQAVHGMDEGNPLSEAINRHVTVYSNINGKEGVQTPTKRDLDVAIEGDGFLVAETQRGIRYTRNGNLHMNSQGVLITADGYPILDVDEKKITLGPGKINIGENGNVQMDGRTLARLKVVRFEDAGSMIKEGNSMYAAPKGRVSELEADAKIKAGFLEGSNVNPVEAVVKMITILRNFEAMQKSITMINQDINKKAIEQLGS